MRETKTKINAASVDAFLNSIGDERVRADCWTIASLMGAATKAKSRMWGANIVGFGTYQMTYADGHTADWPITGFSPRKQNLTLYITPGFAQYDALLQNLGKHSLGKSCLFIKRLADVDLPTLKKLIKASVVHMRKTHPPGQKVPGTF